MTDVYIQRIGTPGTGDKLFPDAAMDMGTLALIDTIDGWAFSGEVAPAADAAILAGTTLKNYACLLYTSPSPRDRTRSRMPSSA